MSHIPDINTVVAVESLPKTKKKLRDLMGPAPRTRCFRDEEAGNNVLCDRNKLVQYYIDEVRDMLAGGTTSSQLPSHIPALEQRGPVKTVRVAQWNINALHGADIITYNSPQSAADAIAAVLELNADVILLQESWKLTFPPGGAPNWPDSADRVQEFLAGLQKSGYTLLAAEETDNHNPPALATRLPILEAGDPFSLDKGRHEFVPSMMAQRVAELRAGRVVDLALGNKDSDLSLTAPALTTVVTHFHHNEQPAAPKFGIRAGEARAIVDACNTWREARQNRLAAGSATIIATDFNGSRRVCWKQKEHSDT